MALTKQKKQEITSKVDKLLSESAGVVFVNFHGLSVSEADKLRKEMRELGIGYTVVKKSLLKRALSERGYKGEMPALGGEVAVAYGLDQVAPAKSAYEFGKKNKEKFALLGGLLGDRFLSAQEVNALALIPDRTTLYAQLVTVFSGPMRSMVTVMSGVQRGFVVALNEIASKKA
ncbi:MAG: 50S ribosomal protein L10 [Candidatus Vogelbacteria bacterium CG10_big_fil_rev_8_21_14_0_10_45_14]|uniref:Large ribosomal subunit protein uL10 n=1 Tax=Candidatus Vogelbacteria bacterium CG10_big_fil_rev_8_21_14_0_10_45_14 TaxID=1975042 RepID=A0A2H0RJI7_9BACT|nr:MAG: 50S ribosomal protein L10 [Candidatus Vogelbacteria bacterium CG10_big_fil_rev_8_21_14_0_10_45_14]